MLETIFYAQDHRLRPSSSPPRPPRLARPHPHRNGCRRTGIRRARSALQRARTRRLGHEREDHQGVRQRWRERAVGRRRQAPGGHVRHVARRARAASRARGNRPHGAARRSRGELRLDRRPGVHLIRRAGRVRLRVHAPVRPGVRREPGRGEGTAQGAEGPGGRGRAREPHRLRRAVRRIGRGQRRHRRPARGGDRRLRRATRARLRVRLRARVRADRARDLVRAHDAPAPVGPDDGDRGLPRRAVPRRAHRPRRVDRLRAAHRRALARGAREGPDNEQSVAARDGDSRPRRRVLRHDRRHRPARADRPAAAVPAQRRLRRHAHPARRDARRDHPAAGVLAGVGPRLDRPASAARDRPAGLVALGGVRRAPSRRRRARRPGDPRRAARARRSNLRLGNADPNTIAKAGDAKRRPRRAPGRPASAPGALLPVEMLVPAARAAGGTRRAGRRGGRPRRGGARRAGVAPRGRRDRRAPSRRPTATTSSRAATRSRASATPHTRRRAGRSSAAPGR